MMNLTKRRFVKMITNTNNQTCKKHRKSTRVHNRTCVSHKKPFNLCRKSLKNHNS